MYISGFRGTPKHPQRSAPKNEDFFLTKGATAARPNVARPNVAFTISVPTPNVARPNVARPNVAFLVRLG
jgi:hypothetical protein